MAIAAVVLATVKPRPTVAASKTNCCGSMSGEEIQNAITAGSGMPAASSAATRGTTPHEQNGDSAPTKAAMTIAMASERDTARPIRRSAPAAFSQAASNTDARRKGVIPRNAPKVNRALRAACSGRTTSRPRNRARVASHTRSTRRP